MESGKKEEFSLLKKISLEEQIEYLLTKIQTLETILEQYSSIFEIAHRKSVEFAQEATKKMTEANLQDARRNEVSPKISQ